MLLAALVRVAFFPVDLWAAFLVGLGLTGLGLVAGVWLGKRRLERVKAERAPLPTPAQARSEETVPPIDRREQSRRSGTWITIFLMDPRSGGDLLEGHVVDFSAAGLGVLLFREIGEGRPVSVRLAHSPDSEPWVRGEVTSCRELDRNVWRVGCHLTDLSLWDKLLHHLKRVQSYSGSIR
jgi:hypothetical protein